MVTFDNGTHNVKQVMNERNAPGVLQLQISIIIVFFFNFTPNLIKLGNVSLYILAIYMCPQYECNVNIDSRFDSTALLRNINIDLRFD